MEELAEPNDEIAAAVNAAIEEVFKQLIEGMVCVTDTDNWT